MGGLLQAGFLIELGFPSGKRGSKPCMWVGGGLLQSDSLFSLCPMWKCLHGTACGLGLLILLISNTREQDPTSTPHPRVRACGVLSGGKGSSFAEVPLLLS